MKKASPLRDRAVAFRDRAVAFRDLAVAFRDRPVSFRDRAVAFRDRSFAASAFPSAASEGKQGKQPAMLAWLGPFRWCRTHHDGHETNQN